MCWMQTTTLSQCLFFLFRLHQRPWLTWSDAWNKLDQEHGEETVVGSSIFFHGMFYDKGRIHKHVQLILPGAKKSFPGTKNVWTTLTCYAHAQWWNSSIRSPKFGITWPKRGGKANDERQKLRVTCGFYILHFINCRCIRNHYEKVCNYKWRCITKLLNGNV